MNKKIIITILIGNLIFLIIFISFLLKQNITGLAISENYTYTKAICNETNFCQDYLIECNQNKVVNYTAITGAFIQHSENWEDPRGEQDIKKFCE